MRQYLFGTGLISAITGGMTLMRGLRSREPFTWRQGLAWASWAISVALAVGAVRDTRRARRGHTVPGDSPVSGKEKKAVAKRVRRR